MPLLSVTNFNDFNFGHQTTNLDARKVARRIVDAGCEALVFVLDAEHNDGGQRRNLD